MVFRLNIQPPKKAEQTLPLFALNGGYFLQHRTKFSTVGIFFFLHDGA